MKIEPHKTIIIMPEKPSHASLDAIKAWIFDFYSLRQIGLEGLCSRIYESIRDTLQSEEINTAINTLWEVEDVQEMRPDLTQVQAYIVLKAVHKEHDASKIVNRATLQDYADKLFPLKN